MKGWHNESYRHSLASRGIKTTTPSFLERPGIRDLHIDELERKLDIYISLIDGRSEIKGGRNTVKCLHDYLDNLGIEVDLEDMIGFFADGNKMFDVVYYEVVGSRAGGYHRPDSDTDVLIYLNFTDTAAKFFKPNPWDWDPFFEKMHEDMVNNNFEVRMKHGGERWIDVHYSWTYPEGDK